MEEIQRKNINEENEIDSLLGDEQRIELIQILIYSASILKDEKQKREEISKIIGLAKKWNIDIKEQFGAKTEESLQKIDSRALLRSIKVKDVMFSLADIAANLGFFDNQEALKEQLETYATMMKDSDKFSQEDINEMTFTNGDYEYQFLNENLTRVEYLANTMFIANKMAHLLVKSKLKDGIETEKIDSKSYGLDLFTMFMRIKIHCMKLLINEKKKGENIKISNTKENFKSRLNNKTEYRDVINIELPGYWQPFTIHANLEEFEEKDKKVIDESCSFISQGFRYTFPLKISPKKHNLFSMIHELNITKYNRNLDRIRWYLSSSLRNDIVKKDVKRTKVREKRRYTGKELTKSKSNEQFLGELQSELGIVVPENIKEGLLHRASYSFDEFMKKMRPIAKSKLSKKGIDEKDQEKELYKLFLHMRLTKSISSINRLPSDSEEFKKNIEASVDGYELTYNYLTKNVTEKDDYVIVRKSIRQISANKEQENSKDNLESKSIMSESINDKAQSLRSEISMLLGVRKTKIDILDSLRKKVAEMEKELGALESRIIRKQMDLSNDERDNQEK